MLVITMKLVERERQLDQLCAALTQAGQGHGRTVLLSGEAGAGKSSLLRAFTDRIAASARVFAGTCDDLQTPRTLGPFRDIARDCGGLGDVGIPDRDAFIEALIAEMSFAQRPAVVIIEDAHWADQASLDIVRVLARRVANLPALLVLTYRDDEMPDDDPLRHVIGSLTGPAVVRVSVPALTKGAVAALANAAGLDPARVVAAVGGNPFYLSEILAEPGAAVPASLRDAVLARVARLPAACRFALEQIAVVPSDVESWLVEAVVEGPGVLEPAERRGMLVLAYRGLRFRHDIARRVIELSMPASRRAAAHRRVLDALVAAGAEPARLVHHAVGAGDDDAVARFAAMAAAEASMAESHSEAVNHAQLALRHGGLLDDLQLARLHGIAAGALYALNRFGEAAEHADRAVEEWDAEGSAPAELAEALLISARMSSLLADPVAARHKAIRAMKILHPLGPGRTLAFAFSTIAAQNTLQGRFADARYWSERALRLAEQTGSDDVIAHALAYRGVSRMSLGDGQGFVDLRDSIAIAQRLDHADYLTISAHNLAVMLIRFGRIAEAKPYLDIAERVAAEHRLEKAIFRIEAQQCHLLMLRGSWDEAERRLRVLVESADGAGVNAVTALAFLGRILARRGDPAAARLIDRGWQLALASGEDQKRAFTAGARIEWFWLTGDVTAVREAGAELIPVAARTGHHALRGEVLRYMRRAGVPVEPFPECPPPFAAGIEGDWERAARLWKEAGNPYEQALELSESPDVAVVTRALDLLDRLGAVAASRIVRRRLRNAGIRRVPRGPRAATRANPAGLTARQVEVLGLLDEGYTNSEIASRLYLSRRTVDNHVSALLRRLGVGTRRAACEAAADAGLLHGTGLRNPKN